MPSSSHSPLDLCDSPTLVQPSGAHLFSLLNSIPFMDVPPWVSPILPLKDIWGAYDEAIVSKAV